MGKSGAAGKSEIDSQIKSARIWLILLCGLVLLFLLPALIAGSWKAFFGFSAVGGFFVYRQLKSIKDLNDLAKKRDDAKVRAAAERRVVAAQLAELSEHPPVPVAVMGASGFKLSAGEIRLLSFRKDSIAITNPESAEDELEIPLSGLNKVEISGPGTVVTNAGLVGGGFGLTGAMKGILAAAIVNKLTTKETTSTVLRLATLDSEVHFLLTTVGLTELRMMLARAVLATERRGTT